ncbi:c-type cytochrome biogenesis protein CcsB [Nocardia cyriacigeorgica]|uniref:Cytochrome c-type biogenesis protein CcmF n=1 Tax=Nocardia cyriacigeorgica TaxID=135487 RepID=A0A4V6ICK6_9NOCA|nr:c-type cytochrome biogenesis protein CcsB [Nocardia cyriacigeorgica]MBF6159776.1 c-type cytochrome biogenesis protein CcsB [Nocardia cyriacigeorgica]MBF6198859.1 c-type cytochrome biogenesis protein CcsB [Nocardia cyriacigeorgica]MBF6316119.1 c-type cytochrome biogenesis protein CcsB [Nocardia cyriacigeorgica]MBF6342338.1 c-type cytochrome biogenesis protein CcsB [Nocardia cyriacigeorgica]MBF6512699.1 c-type cytochrome biogenesis protein CcsB [Nocardia cyriacigeorgica]
MQIDETLARYSDFAYMSAIFVYALVLVLLIVQYASVRTRKVVERELVSAGGGSVAVDPAVPGKIVEAPRLPLSERLGNMAFSVLFVAVALHVLSIVLRGFATHRFPLGNMYEFVTMATAATAVVGLIFLRDQKYRAMWVFLLVPLLILMFLAGTVLYADAAPVVPALKSFWLPIHVTIVSVGSGVFMVSGVASLLFLYRIRQPLGQESDNIFGTIARRLPDARTLDRIAYKTTIIGFPLFGAGVILGAIWAEAAWGRFWGWDPKETCSFIAWVLYAAYLHARATSGWRDTKAAWINIAGFVAMLFNLFIINMVVSGLHSYAGLN